MTDIADDLPEDPTPEALLGSLIPMAMYFAHTYERRWGQDFGEFETAALMGAWDAVQRYNPEAGASLFTYARHRIVGEIIDWHRRERAQRHGFRGKTDMITCVDFNDLGHTEDRALTEASQIEYHYGRTSERGYSLVENRDLLSRLRERMNPREWDIMVRCVCNEETLRSVGESYGVSESRICQILPVALQHARKFVDEMMAEPDAERLREIQWLAGLLPDLPPGADAEDRKEHLWLQHLSRRTTLGPTPTESGPSIEID